MGIDINLTIKRMDLMLNKIPASYSTFKQLKVHKEFLIESSNYLKNNHHKIAFIGKVGVGKTTAISKLLNLMDGDNELLQTGGGRTTICEVEIRESDKISIKIEPYSNEEIKKYLEEFSFHIEAKALKKLKNNQEVFTLSSEIERALRNMLELKIQSYKKEGKRVRVDKAVELFNKYTSRDDFYETIINRIDLNNRNIIELFATNSLNSKKWLRENFKEINNGKNKSVSLPKKIIVYFNENKLKIPNINLSILDTKGVDETANRKDIENQLKNSRTISVLCTSFNDAPDKVSTDILRYMKDSGLTNYIAKRVLILVLDKDGEAESIADLEEPDLEEGREIREEQIKGDLQNSLNLNSVDVVFFNSKYDTPDKLNSTLIHKLNMLRKEHQNQVESIIDSLDEIERQTNNQLSQEALRRVKSSISIWLKKAKDIRCNLKKNFSTISKIILDRGTHVSSVRASVNRYGQWHNLDYYKILSDSSQHQAVLSFDRYKDELYFIISNMLEQKDLNYQKGTLDSIKNILEKRVEDIYITAYNLGKDTYFEDLIQDIDLWNKMKKEWGKGAGYKQRIANHSELWFLNQDYNTFDTQNSKTLNDMWKNLLLEINELIENK